MYRLTKSDVERIGVKGTIVTNILKVKVLRRSDSARLSDPTKEVVVVDIAGNKGTITLKELTARYTYMSGRQVKSAHLHRGKVYLVKETVGKECKVLKIPKGQTVEIDGKRVNSNSVIIKVNDNVMFIPKKYFSKTVKLNEKPSDVKVIPKLTTKNNIDNIDVSKELLEEDNTNYKEANKGAMQTNRERLVAEQRKIEYQVANRKTGNNAVATIINHGGKIMGYVIVDKAGRRHNVKYGNVVMMAKKGNIDNVVAATQNNGKVYLRGFGIRLESLPKVYM